MVSSLYGSEAFDLQPAVFIAIPIVLLIFTTIALSLRIYVRGFLLKTIWWDDWLLILSYLLFVVTLGLTIQIGAIEIASKKTMLGEIVRYIFYAQIVYTFEVIILKASLGLFMLRIAKERWQRWVIHISMFSYTVIMLLFAFITIFRCGKPDRKSALGERKCLSTANVIAPIDYLVAAMNVAIDFMLATTPIFYILKTRMPARQKLSAAFLIALGYVGSIMAIVRVPYIRVAGAESGDWFSTITIVIVLSLMESGLGIFAISLATLRPLFRLWLAKARDGQSGLEESRSDHDTSSDAVTEIIDTKDEEDGDEKSEEVPTQEVKTTEAVRTPIRTDSLAAKREGRIFMGFNSNPPPAAYVETTIAVPSITPQDIPSTNDRAISPVPTVPASETIASEESPVLPNRMRWSQALSLGQSTRAPSVASYMVDEIPDLPTPLATLDDPRVLRWSIAPTVRTNRPESDVSFACRGLALQVAASDASSSPRVPRFQRFSDALTMRSSRSMMRSPRPVSDASFMCKGLGPDMGTPPEMPEMEKRESYMYM